MPQVVLRHPNLPGQPYIVDVPVGGYVAEAYRESGWVIDTSTTPEEAQAEQAATAAAVAARQAAAVESFVPEFAPDDNPPVVVIDTTPPAAPEQPTGPLDTPEGE